MKIKIVDAPCGTGKTTGAINMIKKNQDNKYMFITPFLKEVDRIKSECRQSNFMSPESYGTKLNGVHWLISNNHNIASTHSLFLNFNEYTIELIKQLEYTLILDEVADVVDIVNISRSDLKTILETYAHIEDGILIWDDVEYEGRFNDIKRWAMNKCIGVYGETAFVWCFPVEVFKAFKEVYILTYMFNSQSQRYYYDFYDIDYSYLYVDNFNFTENEISYPCHNYKELIHICDYEKLNQIGDKETALCASWYDRDAKQTGKPLMKVLNNNCVNWFNAINRSRSDCNMWTTYKDYKRYIQGKGYTKGFVPCNARATNDYRDKTVLAYCCNMYMNPVLYNFFSEKGISVNQDEYALSELIQWVFRSAIRDGKEIELYIPSSRMRNLMIEYLK